MSATSQAVTIPKSYTRKIYAHMMPWFEVGGQHWSMNQRNPATGVASYYSPMIGEYSSDDGNVIEYQLLTMKFAGIDGVLVDWPGLNGANDLPQNKANADAIINRTSQFGMQFGIVYEDQYAVSVDAAKNDMSYARDNFFNKSNYVQVDSAPALLVFGPQKIVNAGDWTNIMSVFSTKPTFFALWYNDNAGANAQGRFAWLAQNAIKGVSDFDNAVDGANEGIRVPVLYPGFKPYYQAGGWPGPTYNISYTLKQDNTEGGDTLASTFALGQFAGPFLQVATWNDYGEGTMIEPTNQFQYQYLTDLQGLVGTPYTDAELKIVKLLFDQRRATNGSKQAQLDQASAALANLDFATACGILGCTVPVHSGTGSGGSAGSSSSGGSTNNGGSTSSGGSPANGGSTSSGGSTAPSGGHPGAAGGTTTGSSGLSAGGASSTGSAGSANQSGSTSDANADDSGDSSGSCSVSAAGRAGSNSEFAFAAFVLGAALHGRRRRARAQRASARFAALTSG
ncbi:MAG TPA: hypothetical protein VHV51_04260 [Polyangiaceae bacterium]|nr:hypothetical protein [Polyangiaceae bacterium]